MATEFYYTIRLGGFAPNDKRSIPRYDTFAEAVAAVKEAQDEWPVDSYRDGETVDLIIRKHAVVIPNEYEED